MAADSNALGARLLQILQQGADLCTAAAGAQQLEELLVLQHVLGMVGALAQFPEGAVVLGAATEGAGEAAGGQARPLGQGGHFLRQAYGPHFSELTLLIHAQKHFKLLGGTGQEVSPAAPRVAMI